MIEAIAEYAKKFFNSIRNSVRVGMSNNAIFNSLHDRDYSGIWRGLRRDIKTIRSLTEQADKFKYIGKAKMPTDRFYGITDRKMESDRWSYMKVKGTSEQTGEIMELIVKIEHDQADALTRGDLEDLAIEIASSESYKIEYRLLAEGTKVSFDFGTRRK